MYETITGMLRTSLKEIQRGSLRAAKRKNFELAVRVKRV